MALLEMSDVSKSFPARHGLMADGTRSEQDIAAPVTEAMLKALDNVSLQLERSDAIAIVGESGAGKTTLGGLVAGLTLPDSGTIMLDGLEAGASTDRREWYRRVQLVWQDATGSLDPRMRLERAIAEPLRIRGESGSRVRDKISRLMEEVGLGENLTGRYPHELSGGQAQRAVIARALAAGPQLLVLDEPASALDARVKLRIVDLLNGLRKERGVALMVITHDLRLAVRLADDMAILKAGEVVESGKTSDLITNPRNAFTSELIRAVPRMPGEAQSPT